nr:uncharacterized protein LOC113819326 [Penaeus vannamei]
MEQLNKANACDTTSGSMSPRVTTTDASLEGSTVSSSVPDYALCSEDDSEEQLRENPECMLLLSPTIPRKVPAHKFSLTPKPKDALIKKYQAEVEDEIKMDLTTPHTSINIALDCPDCLPNLTFSAYVFVHDLPAVRY